MSGERSARRAAGAEEATTRFPAGGAQPLRIGITGPIGCGKSTIARRLAEHGAVVVDADVLARESVAPEEPAFTQVIARFGPAYVRPDGSLDRIALGRLVFSDPDRLADLEAIVRPEVRRRIHEVLRRASENGARVVAIEAIRLVESGLAATCDEVWLVTCPPATQRARLIARGMSPEDADQRIGVQAGLAERLRPRATRVLHTAGTPEETVALADAALAEALAARG